MYYTATPEAAITFLPNPLFTLYHYPQLTEASGSMAVTRNTVELMALFTSIVVRYGVLTKTGGWSVTLDMMMRTEANALRPRLSLATTVNCRDKQKLEAFKNTKYIVKSLKLQFVSSIYNGVKNKLCRCSYLYNRSLDAYFL